MDWEAALALALVASLVVVLARGWASPAAVMVAGLVLFVLTGLVPVVVAFSGFSNPATLTIAGLFVVARAVRDHGALEASIDRLLGDGTRSAQAVLVRLVPAVAALSAVVNNTPVVATVGPLLRERAQRRGIAASKLLIPLSFAAILGGAVTTIGTAPNLVVSGVLAQRGIEPFDLFTITPTGLPIAAAGCLVLVLLAPRLLPDRRSVHEQVAGHERDYTVRLRVLPDGDAVGQTITAAALRELDTTYLASIFRQDHEIAPVPPDTVLEPEDELLFVGQVDDIRDLLRKPGLVEAEQPQTRLLDGVGHQLLECVVGATSPLAGATLKETSFRGRYGGAVVAIHRAGEPVRDKLGGVRLHPGDALLVLTDGDFLERWQGRADFAVVAPLEVSRPVPGDGRRLLTLATLAGMVVLAASGVVPILVAVLMACSILVATRTISFHRALDSLDRDVLLIVASAIGVGLGLETSGAAALVASAITGLADATGPLIALAAVTLGTIVLTELITNVAAAALVAPIAIDVATGVGADPRGFAVAVAVAASASFLTPIGYQTNTIVYGLGGYHFGDYWRLGLPLVGIVTTGLLLLVPRVFG